MSTLVANAIKSITGSAKDVDTLVTQADLAGFEFEAQTVHIEAYSNFATTTFQENALYLVSSLFPEYPGIPSLYTYDPTGAKSLHNGRTIISPTVPALSTQAQGLIGWLRGDGDSAGTGILRRVARIKDNEPVASDRGYYNIYTPEFSMANLIHTEYDGLVYNGQAVHPDYIRIPGGFGPQQFEYWLVLTGWIEFDDQTENPMIFASHDGFRWEVPVGVTNPLVPTPAGTDFLSDVDILYADGVLRIYYRETDTTPNPNTSEIKVITSTDGVSWTAPATLTGLPTDDDLLRISPSFTYEGGLYYCWIQLSRTGQNAIARLDSANGVSFSNRVNCIFQNLPNVTDTIWHMDVVATPDGHAMVTNQTPNPSALWFWMSYDGGVTWRYINTIAEQTNRDKTNYFYRSSILFDDDYQGAGIYVTRGNGIGGNMRVAYMHTKFNDVGELIPLGRSGDRQVTRETIIAPSAYIEDLHVGRMYGGHAQVLLGVRNTYSLGEAAGANGVLFNYLQRDDALIIDQPVGTFVAGQGSIQQIVVPEGYHEMKATYQINVSGLNSRRIVCGVLINGTGENRYGLPNNALEGIPGANMNAAGAWISVVPGDVIILASIVTGAGLYNILDSTWLELQFR